MKIAVYTICKNESSFITKWLKSCKGADYLLVTDTGSADDTISKLEVCQLGYENLVVNQVTINPWRFDDARQFSLMSLPDDIDVCICLDMDEVLTEGWRDVVEASWREGTDRLRYNYIWSWNDDGSPAVTYHADKIHKRHGLRWVNPVHEVLAKDTRLGPENQVFVENTLIKHYPDDNKSRSDYLPLLALAVRENPLNDRNAHYYARDLMYAGRYKEALVEFDRHLALCTSTWKPERAASYRYRGDCLWSLGEIKLAIESFKKAVEEAPNEREGYVALAQAYRARCFWRGVIDMCNKALAITERPNSYICLPSAWSGWPETMLKEALKEKDNG